MKKLTILIAAVTAFVAMPHHASAQCTGWPVTCTGINPGGGINPAAGAAAGIAGWAIGTALGNMLSQPPAPEAPQLTPQQVQATNLNNEAVSLWVDARTHWNCDSKAFLSGALRKMAALDTQALRLWPENTVMQSNLEMTYGRQALVKGCNHPGHQATVAELQEALRYFTLANNLASTPDRVESINNIQKQLAEAQQRPANANVCNACGQKLLAGLGDAANRSANPRQFANGALAAYANCTRRFACPSTVNSLATQVQPCMNMDDNGLRQCVSYAVAHY